MPPGPGPRFHLHGERMAQQETPIDPYTLVRKSRMLTEWWFKTFWPSCDCCGEDFIFEDMVATEPTLPTVDLCNGVLSHQDCESRHAGKLATSVTPVRIMAYRKFLVAVFELYQVRCWYCEESLWDDPTLKGGIAITLHHIDEDRGDSRLRGANFHAELEVIHTRCHKAHHSAAPRKNPHDRLNGLRSSRAKKWRYHK